MTTTTKAALEMAASARRDAEQATRARLLSRAATYTDDAREFHDNSMLRASLGQDESDGWDLLYRMVADELRKVAGGDSSPPRVWPTDDVVCNLTPDAVLLLDAARCIVLATPERRVTVGDVDTWRAALATAKIQQQVRCDPQS